MKKFEKSMLNLMKSLTESAVKLSGGKYQPIKTKRQTDALKGVSRVKVKKAVAILDSDKKFNMEYDNFLKGLLKMKGTKKVVVSYANYSKYIGDIWIGHEFVIDGDGKITTGECIHKFKYYVSLAYLKNGDISIKNYPDGQDAPNLIYYKVFLDNNHFIYFSIKEMEKRFRFCSDTVFGNYADYWKDL